MEEQLEKLKRENYLRGLVREEFARKIARIVNEINAAHPFIEGNGRTQRQWLRIVADQAGHSLTFRMGDWERWYEAPRIGFEQVKHGPMIELIKDCLEQENEYKKGNKRISLSSRLEEIRKEKGNILPQRQLQKRKILKDKFSPIN
ncbi:Fic family protein [Paenibacillus provencensis]|uniref:protein adenylyltransferase n=1 Tax=Paenibacillus provencensis TaxID=441151 RepID=A0ABW3PV76_9BACL